ncbi:MAG: hypothetical protein C4558_02420 [Dehalococcoidia bacterium]|nr:MAG: hypothetical protein C4558_02420 [Dehalococcoidia bacterium]
MQQEMKDWPSERVFELAGYVKELKANPAWQEIAEFLSGAREHTINSMAKPGVILEQSQYAKNMGFLSGIDQLPTVADAILRQAEKTERELEKLERSQPDARR